MSQSFAQYFIQAVNSLGVKKAGNMRCHYLQLFLSWATFIPSPLTQHYKSTLIININDSIINDDLSFKLLIMHANRFKGAKCGLMCKV